MDIYVTPPDIKIEEKKPEQAEITIAEKSKTYTQEEVLAILAQVQKGENHNDGDTV